MSYDRDSGHKSFLEDVFQNESRLPGGSWGPSSVPWTDVVSVASTPFLFVFLLTTQGPGTVLFTLSGWLTEVGSDFLVLFTSSSNRTVTKWLPGIVFVTLWLSDFFDEKVEWRNPGFPLISLFVLLLIA